MTVSICLPHQTVESVFFLQKHLGGEWNSKSPQQAGPVCLSCLLSKHSEEGTTRVVGFGNSTGR